MSLELKRTLLITAMVVCLASRANGQVEIGTHRAFPKTTFSTLGSLHASDDVNQNDLGSIDSESSEARFFDFGWWPSFLGGDLFLTTDVFVLHVSGRGSLTSAQGIGAEIRVGPVFLGEIVGFSDNDGLWVGGAVNWKYESVYCGVLIDKWRVDFSGTRAGDYGIDEGEGFVTTSCDVSRRYGKVFFIEPTIRVMFPIASHYLPLVSNPLGPAPPLVTAHYHLRDLFFGVSIKVGIGFN